MEPTSQAENDYAPAHTPTQDLSSFLQHPAVRWVGGGLLGIWILSSLFTGTDVSGELLFKGLHLGMALQDAGRVMADHGLPPGSGDEPARMPNEIGGTTLYGKGWKINSDASGEVVHIELYDSAINQLFNAEDLSSEEFAQRFVNAYDIPEMQPGEEGGLATFLGVGSNWYYADRDNGWYVSLSPYVWKTVEVGRITPDAEMSFD